MSSGSTLNELLWQRIAQILKEQNRTFSDLWGQVVRHKNTYTNWRKNRTTPTISDLEELATALKVSPADLLRPCDGKPTAPTPEQLELPFEPGSKGVRLELRSTAVGFVVKMLPKTA